MKPAVLWTNACASWAPPILGFWWAEPTPCPTCLPLPPTPFPTHHPECQGSALPVLPPPSHPDLIQVLVLGCHRRLQIEDLEARIALMPLLQAEKDRRWGCHGQGQEGTGLSVPACSAGHSQHADGD